MKSFAALYRRLDRSNATRDKLAALVDHFSQESPPDAAWALHYLCGGRVRRLVSTRVLRDAAIARSGLSPWLFEECYAAVGDLAETVALVLEDEGVHSNDGLDQWMRESLLPMAGMPHEEAVGAILACWKRLDRDQRFVFNKLITGGLRVGVSRQLVIKALAGVCKVEPGLIAQRLVGFAEGGRPPDAEAFLAVCGRGPDGSEATSGGAETTRAAMLPFPFQLAQVWSPDEAQAVDPSDCLFEWKWDGIRAQLIREGERVAIWSRGEELITDRFPEVVEAARASLPPGVILDGELLCWQPGADRPMPFAVLQTRIGRKKPGAKTLASAPARFVAFDCLREAHQDLRAQELSQRRRALERLIPAEPEGGSTLQINPVMSLAAWEAAAEIRDRARDRGAEGVMIKHRAARYAIGRTRSPDRAHWWKWKLDPRTVDAVLVYAQPGHGRRAGLYTDYTFALWDQAPEGPRLVPFAKAYSGLTDQEIKAVDAIIRRTTVERFGPVRSVQPTLVFEIAFEGVQASKRHKAGVAVRFPRILRWRTDKQPAAADCLGRLLEMVGADGSAQPAVPAGNRAG